MQVSIREASRQIGTAFPFSLEEERETFEYGGREIRYAAPVSVSGTVTGDGKAYTAQGTGSVVFRSVCDRCLEEFEQLLTFTFSERFVREGAEEEDCYSYSGDTLDLEQVFSDNMLLNMPIINLCKEDCKGLCPQCGANLNRGKCSCPAQDENSAFAILRTMSFDK